MKTKPCEYCHRLPLHAGGCNLLCIKGGWIGRMALNLELMKRSIEIAKLEMLGITNKKEVKNEKRK